MCTMFQCGMTLCILTLPSVREICPESTGFIDVTKQDVQSSDQLRDILAPMDDQREFTDLSFERFNIYGTLFVGNTQL